MTDFLKFFKEYTQKLKHYILSINDSDLKKLNIFFYELIKNKKTLFVVGNESASTARTFANNLCSDIFKKTNKKLFNISLLVPK